MCPTRFNPTTTIRFSTPRAGFVDLAIYDVAGRRVTTLIQRQMPAGRWTTEWDGQSDRGDHVPSGVYFYRLTAGPDIETKKMVLLKQPAVHRGNDVLSRMGLRRISTALEELRHCRVFVGVRILSVMRPVVAPRPQRCQNRSNQNSGRRTHGDRTERDLSHR